MQTDIIINYNIIQESKQTKQDTSLNLFSTADHTLPTRSEPAERKMTQSPLSGTTELVDMDSQ